MKSKDIAIVLLCIAIFSLVFVVFILPQFNNGFSKLGVYVNPSGSYVPNLPPPPGGPPAPILTGINIEGPSEVYEGLPTQYSSLGKYSDNTDETITVSWSENSTFASIDSTGILTINDITSDQTVGITATYGGYTKNFVVTVHPVQCLIHPDGSCTDIDGVDEGNTLSCSEGVRTTWSCGENNLCISQENLCPSRECNSDLKTCKEVGIHVNEICSMAGLTCTDSRGSFSANCNGVNWITYSCSNNACVSTTNSCSSNCDSAFGCTDGQSVGSIQLPNGEIIELAEGIEGCSLYYILKTYDLTTNEWTLFAYLYSHEAGAVIFDDEAQQAFYKWDCAY